MVTIRMLATQNVWAPHDHIGGGDSPDVEGLETLEKPVPPPARPPWRPARRQVPEGDNPTNWAPDHEPYDTVPQGSLPLAAEPLDRWNLSPVNIQNYRAVTVILFPRLPFAFGWLVGNAEWAMGIVRGAHSHECGDLLFRSVNLRPGDAMERLMLAWMTRRQTSIPRWPSLWSNRPISRPFSRHNRAHMDMR